jgi:hypothetical protein
LQLCSHPLPRFRSRDSNSQGPLEQLRHQWEQISVLHRHFIQSSVVHTQPQSAALHLRKYDQCCRSQWCTLYFPAINHTPSYWKFLELLIFCCYSEPGTLSFPNTIFLHSSSQICSPRSIPFGWLQRCDVRVAMSLLHPFTQSLYLTSIWRILIIWNLHIVLGYDPNHLFLPSLS